jgi:hypothetical protein
MKSDVMIDWWKYWCLFSIVVLDIVVGGMVSDILTKNSYWSRKKFPLCMESGEHVYNMCQELTFN